MLTIKFSSGIIDTSQQPQGFPNLLNALANKNVVVVAILENSAYQNFWRSTADCVYTKPEFYSRDKAGLKKVLKENFGIN